MKPISFGLYLRLIWSIFMQGHSISPSNATAETKERAAQVSEFTHNTDFIAEALALREYYSLPAVTTAPVVPPQIKCLAFDCDGTLCTLADAVMPATQAAIAAFKAAGGTVVIATGRSVAGIKNDEFCIKNDELCIKNDEFCIEKLRRLWWTSSCLGW